jgi:hypothetical protein
MRYLALLLPLMAAPLTAAPPRKARLPAGRMISTIKIETHNVFDTSSPHENKLLYRTANRLHIQTRESVVERELLFEVGETFDPLLIEETERNLRALPFIRRAIVSARVNKFGTVDVVVRTYDSWSLEVVANFKRVGGSTGLKAGLAEHNILGEGKSGSVIYSRDGGADSKIFNYQDFQFLRYKRLQYAMGAIVSPGNRNYTMAITRPFYASIARTSAGATFNYTEAPRGTVSRRVAEAGVNYGIAIATSTQRTRHVKFGVLAHRAETTGPSRDLEQLGFLQFGADWEELDFVTLRRIQRFTRDEDYNLGIGVFPSVAWAPPARLLGTTGSQLLPSIAVRKNFAWDDHLLLLNTGYRSKYSNGGISNRVATLDAAYFLPRFERQTLAAHAGVDCGWRMDPYAPLSLGEVNGLRGYGLNEFSGSRRFLFNIEDRIFIHDDLFRLFDVGAVAFFDSGYAWPTSKAVDASDLKNSVGLGLRLASSRSAGNSPVRVDLAYPLNDHYGRTRWSLSILAGQAF